VGFWGFEVASVEHPRLLAAALDEAGKQEVQLARVSMGSGIQLLSDAELSEYLEMAHAAGVDAYCYQSLRNSFEPLQDGGARESLRGERALADAVAELELCVSRGVDGVLVSDLGLLAVAGEMRRDGRLGELGLKAAIAMAPHNAAAAGVLSDLGATSINVSSSATRDDLVAMRGRIGADVTIDIYVEAPDPAGGGLRYRDARFFVEELCPVHIKLGLRNAPTLYPYGLHLEPMAEKTIREKVRRARLVLTQLERGGQVPLQEVTR
jgi:hypothetical protein